jgi:hypothetical protein
MGNAQCNPYITAQSSKLHCANIKGQGKKGMHRANITTDILLYWGGGDQIKLYARGKRMSNSLRP